jgi:hypothetical protein
MPSDRYVLKSVLHSGDMQLDSPEALGSSQIFSSACENARYRGLMRVISKQLVYS